jgi:hypothetical protein
MAHIRKVYGGGVTKEEGDRIDAEARGDLMNLIKEYARFGYNGVHGQGDETFEALWGRAFGTDSIDEPEPLLAGASSMRLPSLT